MVQIFFFKHKTAYEMRISDWSSDVCSSDLWPDARNEAAVTLQILRRLLGVEDHSGVEEGEEDDARAIERHIEQRAVLEILVERDDKDRKRVVKGKSGSVRLDLGGSRRINRTNIYIKEN